MLTKEKSTKRKKQKNKHNINYLKHKDMNKQQAHEAYTELFISYLLDQGLSEIQIEQQIEMLEDFEPSKAWYLEQTNVLKAQGYTDRKLI